MALFAVPRFSNPYRIGISWILSNYVAKTAWQATQAFKQDRNQCITLPLCNLHSSN